MTQERWTEWTEHDGGPCPIPDALAGEWGYKTAKITTSSCNFAPHEKVWPRITHYRLLIKDPAPVKPDYRALWVEACQALHDYDRILGDCEEFKNANHDEFFAYAQSVLSKYEALK